jgi:hypothetical protein
VKLVGVEGGDAPAFRNPPYYDPAALNHRRVILAALTTASDVPHAPFRAARLHLQVTGSSDPQLTAKLIVAASPAEQTIPANVSLNEGAKP